MMALKRDVLYDQVEVQTNSTRTDAQSKELVDALQRKSNECIRLFGEFFISKIFAL
jgi:hypothetical protein